MVAHGGPIDCPLFSVNYAGKNFHITLVAASQRFNHLIHCKLIACDENWLSFFSLNQAPGRSFSVSEDFVGHVFWFVKVVSCDFYYSIGPVSMGLVQLLDIFVCMIP